MGKFHPDFEPNKVFHVYNHAVGNENLFKEPDNYRYFLDKFKEHIAPICKVYAFALLPNHFHFSLKINSLEELHKVSKKELKIDEDYSKFVSQQFSNFFNAYAKAYNKKYERRGALFEDYVKRKPVLDHDYFLKLIQYIHFNPVHHGFCSKIHHWYYTSYHAYLSEKPTIIEREVGLNRFSGIDNFLLLHDAEPEHFDDDIEF
jgi:putative transposase